MTVRPPFKVFDTVRGDRTLPIFENPGAPTNGTSGTFANVAGIGRLLLDITNAVLYQNTNTLASPTWTALTTATGAGTYTGTFDGLVGSITPAAGVFTTLGATDVVTIAPAGTDSASGYVRQVLWSMIATTWPIYFTPKYFSNFCGSF